MSRSLPARVRRRLVIVALLGAASVAVAPSVPARAGTETKPASSTPTTASAPDPATDPATTSTTEPATTTSATEPTSSATAPATGTVVVRAVGDRDLATGLAEPLAGALLRAYTDATLHDLAGECTTDSSGTCAIAGLAPGTYHIAPARGPVDGGWHPLERIGTSLGDDERYAEAVEVGEGAPVTRRFAFRRDNPAFPPRCGIRLTLLYDLSASIDPEEAAAMKSASLEFVDALEGTP